MISDVEVDAPIARGGAAQRAFANWSEGRVDALLTDIAQVIADHAEALAIETVAETGLGNVPDKTLKNRVGSQLVLANLLGKPAAGLLRIDAHQRVAELASPMGVIFGLIPRTHPVATFVFKVLISLKGRNALIVSSHRGAQGVTSHTGELITGVLERHGAPIDLVQWLRQRTNRDLTLRFMRHPDIALILATGGSSMVHAAYSSGTPAIGVGPGNAPTWVAPDADVDRVAEGVVASKSFDHGIICASENNLVVDASIRSAFVSALERHGALVLGQSAQIDRFVTAVFDPETGHVRRDLHGVSATRLAEIAGLAVSGTVRLIVVPASLNDLSGPLGFEKLAPVTALFTVRGDDEALDVSRRLLANEGAGHTAVIHTADEARIKRFSQEVAASRILVNVPATQGSLGMVTGLVPTMMLGTGTLGGTSTTDSITYTHLLNVKRIAYPSAA